MAGVGALKGSIVVEQSATPLPQPCFAKVAPVPPFISIRSYKNRLMPGKEQLCCSKQHYDKQNV